MYRRIVSFVVIIFAFIVICSVLTAELTPDEILNMLDVSLKKLPEKIVKLKPEVRRIAFYSLKVDRANITQPLFRQIQGKIEAAFLQLERPILVYTPEVKPLKIVSKEDSISFTSGFQSTDEIKEIAQKLKLDGFLEGELYCTDVALYLNLRIFESDSMAVVWSEEFTSIVPPTPPKPPTTSIDFGIGGSGLQLTEVSPNLSVPSYAHYYTADLRILQKTFAGDKAKFTLTGGFLYLYTGIKSSTVTIVSSEGYGPVSFFARVGVRISLIPVVSKKEEPARDWLALELSFGRIFGSGTVGLDCFGVKFDSDITKDISVAAGISFVPNTEISIGDSKVKAGGLAYEISLLRFSFLP